jgi:hypothetical protein
MKNYEAPVVVELGTADALVLGLVNGPPQDSIADFPPYEE